jgi:hypothetical protein
VDAVGKSEAIRTEAVVLLIALETGESGTE